MAFKVKLPTGSVWLVQFAPPFVVANTTLVSGEAAPTA